ncbi:MAG TPA: cobalamin-dependent protein [Dongiaceae bacterium]|nr:cobalamin-dependent protein [Dongiaceae bacterium]
MDLLFLHAPKFHNYYKPIGEFSFILFPPIGLLGLADFLVRHQHTARIVHLGVEDYLHGPLDLDRLVRENQPSIVGLDLHWHFQSYDVIEVARKIKQTHPEVAVLLGGFTASVFADEILRDYPFVDFVIRGDAELPILELIRRFTSDKNYDAAPNLAYRHNAEVISNPQTYVADSAALENMCFTDFTLMKDYPTFVKSFSRYLHSPTISDKLQRKLFGAHKAFQVYVGRGCVHNCCYCGGSREAHELIAARQCVALRSVSAIVSSICDLERFGFDSACVALDSFPYAKADVTYAEIFEELKRRNVGLDIEVERYFLPNAQFLEGFAGLKGKESFVTLSPHSHNEELRRRNSLYRYSNAELEVCLDAMEARGVNSLLCFTCGLPGETRQDLEQMAAYQVGLRRRYQRVRFKTCMIEIEPGCAMSRDPDRFGIAPERRTFAEYYSYHRLPRQNHWQEMGYSRSGCPSHSEVSSFFCTHFCERFKSGWASPIVCKALEVAWKVGTFQAVDKILGWRDQEAANIRS